MAGYNDMDGVRWSVLRDILTSPKHYRHREQHTRDDSPAMALGRAVHCAVLEPERFRAEAVQPPPEHLTPSGALSTKPAARAWLESLGPEPMVLSERDWDACLRIAEAVAEHPDAALWLDEARVREHAVQWTETIDNVDVQCKAKVDAYCPRLSLLWDLKTVGGFAPFTLHRCEREIVSRLYYAQLGFYLRGLEAAGNVVESIGWICVESRAPFDVAVIEADADLLQAAREEADKAVIAYAHAVGSGSWHGVAPAKVVMRPPAWMLMDEDNTADEELEFEEVA